MIQIRKVLRVITSVLVGIIVMISSTLAVLAITQDIIYYFSEDSRFSFTVLVVSFVGLLTLSFFLTLWLKQNIYVVYQQQLPNPLDSYTIDDLIIALDKFKNRWIQWPISKRLIMLSSLEDLLIYKIKNKQDAVLYRNLYDTYCDLSEYSSQVIVVEFVEHSLAYVSQYRLGILTPKPDMWHVREYYNY